MLIGGRSYGKAKDLCDGRPGLAIKGYDPVAYFDQGGPRVSLAKYTWQHAANL